MASVEVAPIHVGCCGWLYPWWRDRFYPAKLPQSEWLTYYATHFHTVEVNSTFYRSPTVDTVVEWRERVPPGFVFSVKASRLITHRKKLQDTEGALARFLARVEALGDKLGPILFQLPPRWSADLNRLEAFLHCLPRQHTYAFEFRHPSWFVKDVLSMLARCGAGFCVHDFPGLRVPRKAVGKLVYVRLHGSKPAYAGRYSRPRLRRLARWLRSQARQGKTCYVYFNNDVNAAAPADAMYLQTLLQRWPVAPGTPAR